MSFLTGAKLMAALMNARFANQMSSISGLLGHGWNGVRKSKHFRYSRQSSHFQTLHGTGEQEQYRRRIGGFYQERKHHAFPQR